MGDALGRGVGAMGGAERVVHVEVRERREPTRKLGVVLGLARLEAAVLEHQHIARLQARGQLLHLRPDDGRRRPDRGPEQLPEPSCHRRHGESRIGPLRPVQVGDADHGGASLPQQLDRRQRGADPGVVGHLAVFERHVEVDPHENAPAVDRRLANGRLGEAQAVPTAAGFGSSTFVASSTQRFE